MENSSIAWCHHTLNFWIGCELWSPGCANCYAKALSETRLKSTIERQVGSLPVWGRPDATPRYRTAASTWAKPLAWNRAAARAGVRYRVFTLSLGDFLEDHPLCNAWRSEAFEIIETTPHLDWMILTKRPERWAEVMPATWKVSWPSHVWPGVTVEDQAHAEERVPQLLALPAPMTFLSIEPQLENVVLRDEWLRGSFHLCPADGSDEGPDRATNCTGCTGDPRDYASQRRGPNLPPSNLHTHLMRAPYDTYCEAQWRGRVGWIITGGESHDVRAKARPYKPSWTRSLIEQGHRAKVPVLVKQMGSNPVGLALAHPSGERMEEWPEDLRVREFPVPPALWMP